MHAYGKMSRRVGARVALGVMTLAFTIVVAAPVAGASPVAPQSRHEIKFPVRSKEIAGLGTVLTTPAGYTLYVYTGDTQDNSTVASQPFAPAWPAVTLPAGRVLTAGRGIVGLGDYPLSSGQEQITWNGLPLYTFIKDTSPGVASGQGIRGFVVAFVQLQKPAKS
jgi:predicted lipoprotein with Yx(FWY)xxD motif